MPKKTSNDPRKGRSSAVRTAAIPTPVPDDPLPLVTYPTPTLSPSAPFFVPVGAEERSTGFELKLKTRFFGQLVIAFTRLFRRRV